MLKFYRTQKGLTQQELADKSGVNIRQIQKYESGFYVLGNMTLKTAVALADALEIPVRSLIEYELKTEPLEAIGADEQSVIQTIVRAVPSKKIVGETFVEAPSEEQKAFIKSLHPEYDVVDDGHGGIKLQVNEEEVKRIYEEYRKCKKRDRQ